MNPVAFTGVSLTADVVMSVLIFLWTFSPMTVITPWTANTVLCYPAMVIRLMAWAGLVLLFTGAMNSRNYVFAIGTLIAALSPGLISTVNVLAMISAKSNKHAHVHTSTTDELAQADKSD